MCAICKIYLCISNVAGFIKNILKCRKKQSGLLEIRKKKFKHLFSEF